jgi:hypothetical protein
MRYDNTPKIVGAGRGVAKMYTYYSSKAGDVVPLPKKAARKLEKFSQMQQVEKMKFSANVIQPAIKTWEDRNLKNRGSKLNP